MSYDDYDDDQDEPARHGTGSFRNSGFFQGGPAAPQEPWPPAAGAPGRVNPLVRAAQLSPPEHRSMREVTRPGHQPMPGNSLRPGRRPGLVALACVLALAVLAGGGYAGFRWFQSRPAATTAGPGATAVKGESTTAPSAEGLGSSGRTVGQIGTTVRDGDFAFKVARVSDGGDTLGSGTNTAKASGRFVLVHVTVKNVSGRSSSLLPAAQHVQDASLHEYAADPSIAAAASRRLWGTIRPGAVARGIMVFDVPKQPAISNLLLQGGASSPGAALSVT